MTWCHYIFHTNPNSIGTKCTKTTRRAKRKNRRPINRLKISHKIGTIEFFIK
eukprot:CAMPEP_0201559382 /NCGR_PEP_ID=MMETSP0173_2-20130828/73692_1 /ASSEMBLY_ACC=CAM_ASM_000268 /TAXON_ID=218659 /ORGANISM="Vexillifera sp., Strain DIVA3 564/2" /LENGTH=51 /DNA_ID=CAMNT_0047973343 /DNA_START=26 /DNA_END=178 /DNA_ORIENTATION=-